MTKKLIEEMNNADFEALIHAFSNRRYGVDNLLLAKFVFALLDKEKLPPALGEWRIVIRRKR